MPRQSWTSPPVRARRPVVAHAASSRRRVVQACLIVALIAAGVAVTRAQSVPDEYRLKAAFLHRFAQFVEWPGDALTASATVDICLVGNNPFGDVLNAIVAGETLGGRPFTVREVTARNTDSCHLLYIAAGPQTRRAVLAQLADAPILTVGDATGFLDEGGIVELRLVDNRVRFAVNARAAQQAGLRLSAQLMRLALNVEGAAE